MDSEYLLEGFDPKTLKVAQLRRILVEHGVDIQLNSKKAELVKAFNRNIKPRREELLLKKKTVKPSSEGIVKVKKKKSKKRAKSEEADGSRSKGSARVASTSSALSETESIDGLKVLKKESSPFTDVNDFQKSVLPKKRRGKHEEEEDEENPRAKKTHAKKPKEEKSPTLNSPITEKVRSKRTPTKSPHRSLVIDKFESSSESSSASLAGSRSPMSKENFLVFEQEKDVQEKLPIQDEDSAYHDFSFKRKTMSPDLSKLKVSPAFAKQLMKVTNQNQSTPAKKTSPEPSFDNLPSFSATGKGKEEGAEQEQEQEEEEEEEKQGSREATESSESSEVSGKNEDSTEKSQSVGAISNESNEPGLLSETEVGEESDETIASSEAEDNEEPIEISELEQQIDTPKISTPELPTKHDIDAMEEKLKEEEEKIREGDEKPERAVGPENKNKPKTAHIKAFGHCVGRFLFKVSTFVLIVLPILFGLWYREQRVLVGYCGHEINLPTFQNPDNLQVIDGVESFLEQYKPQCLPCPENAICYPYMRIKCKPDYAITPSKLSLYGLFPVSDYCVKDSKKEKLISEVVKKSLELLRTKNSQIKCGENDNDFESGITEEELHQIFYESRAPWINDEEFNDLWVQVVEDLKDEPEIIWRQLQPSTTEFSTDTDNSTETNDIQKQKGHFQYPEDKEAGLFRSTSKKYIGLKCKFEREVYQTYKRFRVVIWSGSVILLMVQAIKYKLQRYFEEQKKVETLTEQVIKKLKRTANETVGSKPKFLSTVQLRDVLLSDIVDLKFKNHLWNKVAKKLEHNNTNVKSSLMEVHGEIMKCWEWIGPLEDETTN